MANGNETTAGPTVCIRVNTQLHKNYNNRGYAKRSNAKPSSKNCENLKTVKNEKKICRPTRCMENIAYIVFNSHV